MMDENTKNSPCKECRDGEDEVSLHAELDHLRQHLAERDSHIVAVEAEFIKSTVRLNDLEEQVTTWREKYERLYDSHKRVQKLNQVLEDKLLQMVDKMKGEKSQLTKDIATLSVRLAEAKHNCSMLQKENERYKNDMNLAIQLLQCKPDNFVAQKLDSLPVDTQARVSQYVMSKTVKSPSSLNSKNGNENDTFDTSEYEFNISASLMSKILEDSIQDTVSKHCDTCTCNKSQNKPFCYNESYYTIATQTHLTGEIKNSLCLNCKSEVKSINSNVSIRSNSPHMKISNDSVVSHIKPTSDYAVSEGKSVEAGKVNNDTVIATNNIQDITNDNEYKKCDQSVKSDVISIDQVNEVHDIKLSKKVMSMEPAIHHKLCDRTKTSISSKKSSVLSLGHEELLTKDSPIAKESTMQNENLSGDNISIRKNSHSSMGAVSRTSVKSTASAAKSNTQVGPGPRFCHLRMQAGSKNILLDNAQPDVPPVLYRRQSRCNEDSIFRDDIVDHFLDSNKEENIPISTESNNNLVVESTLIDVHVDNNNKEANVSTENTSINPVLLNVSSSPLQPLKTHNFSNSMENNKNNNNSNINQSQQSNTSESTILFKEFTADLNSVQNNNNHISDGLIESNVVTPIDNPDVKIFNFDRYEQGRLASQYNRYLRKIDMSHFHSIENTRISKDISSQEDFPKLEKKLESSSKVMPPIVNVYPNLTQTHLKVNDKKVSTNEQSSSSLSSDDSAAMLQKQQLLRVAEWVEKNLEQQNNFKDPIDEEVTFNSRTTTRDRLNRLNQTINEIVLNMPHPVSKYSKPYSRDAQSMLINAGPNQVNENKFLKLDQKIPGHLVKETIFPVESNETTFTEVNNGNISNESTKAKECKFVNDLGDTLKSVQSKDITAEELARMEYNVKKFLLSGPQWATPDVVGRSRRTSSKTETDV